ncbi:Hypothetical protein CAP_3245 [Chondromyces apiculatus DSM 436]|uniref:Uncharacterized protein n=1 Tax=Chondromyces apiculatus DSM 436 TaxID=1192034 RepID=A0A017T9B9_9BACT|nr:Hypothetical protein CAP_3245 [Chondromyces apiculatus DSM 436]
MIDRSTKIDHLIELRRADGAPDPAPWCSTEDRSVDRFSERS